MRCADIMKMDVKFVRDDDTVLRAAQIMRDHNLQFLPVVDLDMHVLGTITDRDIAVRVASEDRRSSGCMVRDVRSNEVPGCGPEDDAAILADVMADHNKSRLLVIDERGVLCGTVNRSDIQATDDYDAGVTMMLKLIPREARLN